RYEIFLRYYVLGLCDAGSPYAFHTLGSTLAFRSAAYAMVRGFPRRLAGEDFYFLNKIAKLGNIVRLDGAPILIEGRRSDRAPFGTGAALNNILADEQRGEGYRTYAPEVFLHLKAWLKAIELISRDFARADVHAHIISAARLDDGVDADVLHREVVHLGLRPALEHIRQISRQAAGMARHLHTWFDAFRTLKLIHRLSLTFPKRELLEAVRAAPFVSDEAKRADTLEGFRRSLFEARYRGPGPVPGPYRGPLGSESKRSQVPGQPIESGSLVEN